MGRNDYQYATFSLVGRNDFPIFFTAINSKLFAVIVGEIANFVAYIYAPAVLVTPLGALSIIVR